MSSFSERLYLSTITIFILESHMNKIKQILIFLKLSSWYIIFHQVINYKMFIKIMNAQCAESGYFSNRKMDYLYSSLILGWSQFNPLNCLNSLTAWPRDWRAKRFKAKELGGTASGKTNRNLKENISENISHSEYNINAKESYLWCNVS